MRFRDNMTPVVGTALAAVAAGCLVLFSLVLQQSAFESPISRGLRPMAPNADGRSVTVAAPEDETGTGGDGSTVAENGTGSAPTTPTTGTETFSPAPDAGGPADDSLVASVDDDSNGGDGDFPTLGGGTGSTIVDGSDGPTLSATGPQATINKDPDSQPDDVTLPDRRGPRNSAPPHGSPPRSDDDRDEDDGKSKGKDDKPEPKGKDDDDDDESKGKDDKPKGKSKGKDDKDDGKSKGKDDKPEPKGKDDDNDDESKGKDDKPEPKGKDDNDDDDDEPKGKDDNDDDSGGPGGKGKPIASPGNSKSDGSGPEGRPAKPQPKPATPEEPSTPEKPAKPAAPPQREAPEANVPKDSQKSKGKPRTGGKK